MSRDPFLRLEDIIDASESIQGYLSGYDYDAFINDRRTVDAVTRNLEIIGEAVKNLPESMLSKHPHIPWRAIAGFRDILAHGYFRAEDSIIWDAATVHLPPLIKSVKSLNGSK
jgi:uncharacterized protein with HEPN domain